MKLEKIYRDIVSLFKAEGLDHSDIYASDIIHSINDSIATQRIKQVKGGVKTPFVTEEEIPFNMEDRNVSYLNKTTIEKAPLQELPLHKTVVTAIAKKSQNRLTKSAKAWSQGDEVVKGRYLYKAVVDVPSSNTYDLTFDPQDVIPYVKNKDYITGDVIYYNQKQTYWEATSDFKASGDPLNDTANELYWKQIGGAEVDASIIAYENKRDLKVLDVSITINDKTIFTTPDIGYLFLEYVPVWEPVEELDGEIDLPISILQVVKRDVFQRLSPKLRTSQEQGGQDE